MKIQFYYDKVNLMMNECYAILEFYNKKFFRIIESQPKINLENYEKIIITTQNLSYFISCIINEFEKYQIK